MNLLVAGCGMVGAKLALRMCRMGHDVSVVDREEESFEKLGAAFTGLTFVGNIIDLDVLRREGIEGCDAVAAVTNSDNVNVMISQIARDIFSIPRVLTRVYDPDRERIFAQFGLHTICPTALTVESAVAVLTEQRAARYVTMFGQTVALSAVPLPAGTAGTRLGRMKLPDGMAAGVLHKDGAFELCYEAPERVLQEEDRLLVLRRAGEGGVR